MICVIFSGFHSHQQYISNAAIRFGNEIRNPFQMEFVFPLEDLQNCCSVLQELGYTTITVPHKGDDNVIRAYALK